METLVLGQTHLAGDLSALENSAKEIRDSLNLLKISSVYRANHFEKQVPLSSGVLSVVYKLDSDGSTTELFEQLQGLRQLEGKRTVNYEILFVPNFTVLRPGLTIPHPDLHNRPDWLVPCAEIMPDSVHPILNKSLSLLSKEFDSIEWGEFFAQGKSLIK